MAAILLDTTIASQLHSKKAQSSILQAYANELINNTFSVSFQTAAELLSWPDRNHWGPAARAELESVLARFVVIGVDMALMRTWATVMRQSRLGGRRLEADDGWVVATAVRHDLPLVTHDRDMIGVPIEGLTTITHLR